MKSLLAVLTFVCLLCCVVEAFKWRGVNENGAEVVRILTVEQSPAQGELHTIEWRAVQRDVSPFRKGIRDAIDFLFSTNFFPHYALRHFDRYTDTTELRAARHGLRKLVEYEENTAVNGFDPDVDTIVQNYTLWDKVWSNMTRVDSMNNGINSNGAQLITICTHTEDGVVELCMYFTDIKAELSVNGSAFMIDNNAIHHTLTIRHFPWMSNTSRLAVKIHLDVREDVKNFTDQNSVNSTAEGAYDLGTDADDANKITPVAAWSNTVNVTGPGCAQTADVVKQVVRDTEWSKDVDINFPNGDSDGILLTLTRKITYFSFITDCPKPREIYWDPELGISDQADSTAIIIAPSFFAFFAAIIFAIYAVAF